MNMLLQPGIQGGYLRYKEDRRMGKFVLERTFTSEDVFDDINRYPDDGVVVVISSKNPLLLFRRLRNSYLLERPFT